LVTRRRVIGVLAALPVASALARDYASEAEVLNAIDVLSAEVAARLGEIARKVPRASTFATSARADLARHRVERGAADEGRAPKLDEPSSLPRLRAVLQELVHAHAEGLPALARGATVQRLAEHMVDLSRLLTVVDLWLDAEGLGD
jgi:hypothetical protein